jgi:hypothetical protein
MENGQRAAPVKLESLVVLKILGLERVIVQTILWI